MELNDKKFAVLVDADNISHRKIKDILDEIANYGTPTIKRIYGDFTNPKFAAWKEVLLENSITPIQQYAYTTGKNATDSALIIDAMDILHKEGVDGFCIVSSDSDYTRLASRIRESGREVLGFGEKKTPKPFIKSCDKFIYVEILGQTPPEKAAPAKKKADAKRSAGAEAPVGPAAETAGEKKPSPDAGHASTIIRPFDDEFRTLLENTIDDAADDSVSERGKRKRPLSAEAMHGGEKQQHQKRPTQYRHGLDRAEKRPLAVIQKHLIRRGHCDREQIYARRHILPRRVQQLIGRDARDGAHEQHGRPRRTRQQYQQQ